MANSNSQYLILACDGGGIRGLITSLLLQKLDQDIPNFLSNVYLHAGTSTGGIISLALACGVSTSDLVTLYSEDGSQIFTESACLSGAAPKITIESSPTGAAGESWWEFIVEHIMDFLCPWYDNSGLRTLIENTLQGSANVTLNSLAQGQNPQYVLVNTTQLCNSANAWFPLQLTNLPNITNNNSGETLVIDAALSTSAAPMYFPPYNHPTYGYCADGGIFANNPGTIAVTTLMESGVSLENIWMLSLSTGNTLNCYPPSIINTIGASNFGPLFWMFPVSQPDPAISGQPYTPAMPLMNVVFDGTSDVDANQCSQLLQDRFRRANVPLSQPIALNDDSAAAITAMTDSTNTYFGTPEWGDIESWIKTNFP